MVRLLIYIFELEAAKPPDDGSHNEINLHLSARVRKETNLHADYNEEF